MPRHRWPQEALDYLSAHYGLKPPAEICDDIARMFGFVVTEGTLMKKGTRLGIKGDRHGTTITKASKELGISHSAVRWLIKKRGIQTYGTGCRRYIPEPDMQAIRDLYQRPKGEHLTVAQAAQLVGLSRTQILNLIRLGRLRAKRSGRLLLVFKVSAEGLLKSRTCSYRMGRYVNVPFYRLPRKPLRPVRVVRFWAPDGGFRVAVKGARYWRTQCLDAQARAAELERLEKVVKQLLGSSAAGSVGVAIAKLQERARGVVAGPPVKVVVQTVVAPQPATHNPDAPPGPPPCDDDDDPKRQWRPRRKPLCVSCVHATVHEDAELGYMCALKQNQCQPLGAGLLYKPK